MKEFTHHFLDRVYHFEYLTSTMNKAEELIELNNELGNILIISARQGSGIGRKDNYWYSPQGGLWFTLGIYGFSFKTNFTLFTGIQILNAIETLCLNESLNIRIKWPNDIFLNDKKAAGIIVKHLPKYKYYLIGVGINANVVEFPPELKDIATSLWLETGKIISLEILLKEFLDNMIANLPLYLTEFRIDEICYQQHDYLKGLKIMIKTEFAEYCGDYYGISPEGAILMKLAQGSIQPFFAGEVRILG